MGHYLYALIIAPLEYLYAVVFRTAYVFSGNIFFSIVLLSLAVFILTLPMYSAAERKQKQAADLDKKMKPGREKISKAFSGDEKVLLMAAYNKLCGYSVFSTIKGSLSLIIQIPFFMAAYNYLSGLAILESIRLPNGNSFATEDEMLSIGGYGINILPVIMTLINIISALIYSRGEGFKDKIRLIVTALVFLVLLYNSPSGLVLYWICNNVLSLLKNLFRKPQKIKENATETEKIRNNGQGFLVSAIAISFFIGSFIPLRAIVSSPFDFIKIDVHSTPLYYWFINLLSSSGLFILWGGLFYYLADTKRKRLIECVYFVLLISAVINFFFFSEKMGVMSAFMVYDVFPEHSDNVLIIGTFVGLIIPFIVIYIYMKRSKILYYMAMVMSISFFVLTFVYVIHVNMMIKEMGGIKKEVMADGSIRFDPVIHLSKGGKNVVIIVLDRAIGYLEPFVLQEKSELKEQFAGFTFYPNTVSCGLYTIIGAPALYGGYDYTAKAMEERTDETIAKKSDDALKLMPSVFSKNGYKVSIADAPNAGFTENSDLSIFESIPGVETHRTFGVYSNLEDSSAKKEYNFFMYSIYRCTTPFLGYFVYDEGKYLSLEGEQVNPEFVASVSTLMALPQITDFEDSKTDNMGIIYNYTTHSPELLEAPDYLIPEYKLDREKYDYPGILTAGDKSIELKNAFTTTQYDVYMATFIQLGKWFDHLREEGVYDNTRIIIVADHGYGIAGGLEHPEGNIDVLWANPLLMVKDFSDNTYDVSEEFMTNADVPVIAMQGLIQDMRDPFTGKELSYDDKYNGKAWVYFSKPTQGINSRKLGVNEYAFDLSDAPVYSVSGNIFDADNWKLIREAE